MVVDVGIDLSGGSWRVCPSCEVWWLAASTKICWLCGTTGVPGDRPGMNTPYCTVRMGDDERRSLGGWRTSPS